MGDGASRFHTTCWTAIDHADSPDPEERQRSWGIIVATYWKPVYKYIRIRWRKSNDDAKDLTQGFFSRAMEKAWFRTYDPGQARFRTFLRTCLEGYLANQEKAAGRLKRGGDRTILSLDFEQADGELRHEVDAGDAVEEYFDREWVRSLFSVALARLEEDCQERGREVHFQLFARYDLDETGAKRPTYEELAVEHGISVTQVTNHLATIRRQFRKLLLEHLRQITGSEEEYRAEARTFLGIEV